MEQAHFSTPMTRNSAPAPLRYRGRLPQVFIANGLRRGSSNLA